MSLLFFSTEQNISVVIVRSIKIFVHVLGVIARFTLKINFYFFPR